MSDNSNSAWSGQETLRFVPAAAVEASDVDFDELPVETYDRRRLGRLAGVVIDLFSRRLRYVVVDSSRWAMRARRLVPFSSAQLDTERQALRIDPGTSIDDCPEFDASAFRRLCGDELLITV